ncbi:CHAT domain-containing protein [Thermosynechococcaceae cyanobacterium BACA0444]|uniref:CHAT domain-containing protein n=1 Tax=Pseudocalidococcus azoricus BACA0444 TaxID=2918990 RepID=A0AAE4JXB8_9CYAN|nr:CHAT domain-containing protein [Pseudocalidococcus azoricus]MDS3859679.1 CHAT domain-containing protein [Pseudocalidococcus azoricus BACA0444]
MSKFRTGLVIALITFIIVVSGNLMSLATMARPQVSPELSQAVLNMEKRLKNDFDTYFGRDLATVTQDPATIATSLAKISRSTGQKTAVLWVIPRANDLHLVLITPNQAPVVKDLPEARQELLLPVVEKFQREVSSPVVREKNFPAAQQLYRWIIAPFEAEYLQPQGIESLLFCLGSGVRTLPLAALFDGQQFLVENYALSRIPAFNLIKLTSKSLHRPRILAMGASEFRSLSPLPAVPVELNTIVQKVNTPRSAEFLNQDFTLENLKKQLRKTPFDIVHLATHAEFRPGTPNESFIQLWDQSLNLQDMDRMPWQKPMVDLLVLSACRTAVGDHQAELGFAGVALQAGVKSALASLWYVDDLGTLALMGEFYGQMSRFSTKGEALRQAQLHLLRGEVEVIQNTLHLSKADITLPSNLARSSTVNFRHPRYWAAFTMISSPW